MISAALAALLPKGRCRLLLGASIGLNSISSALALAPALIVYAIAAVMFYRSPVGGLTVMQIVFAALGAAIARLTLLLWARLTAGSAVLLASDHVRGELAAKIGTLPIGMLAESRPGSWAAQLLDDVDRAGAFVTGDFVDLVGAVAMVIAAGAVLAWRDWTLAGIFAVLIVAGWALGALGGKLRPEAAAGELRAREALAAATLQALRGTIADQTLPPVAPDADPLRVYAAAYRDATKARSNRSATVEAVWRSYAGALPALLMLAGLIVAAARLDFPALVLVVALGLRINGALTTTLGAGRSSASAFESIRRLMATLQLPAATGGDAPPPADTTLRFAGVTFAYPGAAEPVLRDVEFVAERGSVTAIVGPSGSGKTTLMRLAAGFWAPDSGTVELGGVALQAISSDALAQRVTCVFQDVALLDDTIAANLRLGRPDADDAMLVQAARAAGADEFISALPDDYQTVVGDRGLRLSRGERQRLQIARALLRDAPVILLDEPTASLDPATESEIQDALVSLVRGKTVLTVTHRLGTIVDADRIVVLDGGGRVEAIGTHGRLLSTSPTYARLWADYTGAMDWIADPGVPVA